MLTSSEATTKALNWTYLDQDTGQINELTLNHDIQALILTNGRLWGLMKNPKSKATTTTFAAFTELANEVLKVAKCLLGGRYYATGQQLRDWLWEYGEGFDSIKDSLDFIKENKEE